MSISQAPLTSQAPNWARSTIEAFVSQREFAGRTSAPLLEEDAFVSHGLIEVLAAETARADNGPTDTNPEVGVVENDQDGVRTITYFQQGQEDFTGLSIDQNVVSYFHNGVDYSAFISVDKDPSSPLSTAFYIDHNDPSKNVSFE
jgi:hypothetical protein